MSKCQFVSVFFRDLRTARVDRVAGGNGFQIGTLNGMWIFLVPQRGLTASSSEREYGEKSNAQAVLHECVAMLVVRSSEAFRHPS